MGATNFLEKLDPGLLRPGRLDRWIPVGLPNLNERVSILELMAKKSPFDSSLDFKKLAKIMEGCTGAEVVEWSRQAVLYSLNREADLVQELDFEQALNSIVFAKDVALS
jgi:ATP-dependent 26S proteasome regulatory subunit